MVVGVFAIVGGLFAADSVYVRATDFCQLEKRVERKIAEDKAFDLRRRQWQLQLHYGEEKAKQMPEYKELENEREKVLRTLGK